MIPAVQRDTGRSNINKLPYLTAIQMYSFIATIARFNWVIALFRNSASDSILGNIKWIVNGFVGFDLLSFIRREFYLLEVNSDNDFYTTF